MGCTSPKFYGIPKIHKPNTSLRPIISSRGSHSCGVAKVLAKILKPLVGKSMHHVHSTKDFFERVSKVTLQLGECLCSYNATALFTSVPVDPAFNIIQDLPEQETSLRDRAVLLVQNIIELLGFSLHKTYFSFQDQFHEQIEGMPMGSPVSSILTNLYMQHFERNALSNSSTPGYGWDMCMIHLAFERRDTSKPSWNISIKWIQPLNLQLRVTKKCCYTIPWYPSKARSW